MAAPPSPTPTATAAETPSAAEVEPELTPAAEGEPPSLLTLIDGSTRPNVAAALRLAEEGRTLIEHQAYELALDRLERALAVDPANAYGYYFLARLHYLKRGYDQAIAFADKAALLNARADQAWTARAYSLQGAVFEEVGRYPDARAAYQRALAADPRNLAAQTGLARLGGNADAP